MRAYNGSAMDHGLLVRLAFCAAALIAGISAAPAAEMKGGAGPTGPAQATGGRSATMANPGGAGGVGNPDPGGSPGSFGDPGLSAGSLGTTRSQRGYVGGRVDDPTDPGGEINPLSTTSTMAQQLGQCDLIATRGLTPDQRMAGGNGRRLQYGSRMIAPETAGRYRGSRHVMLASYQDELGKGRPDVMLAGTYLGIAADTPVTARTVSELNDALCVQAPGDLTERIASIAEAQRQKLESEGQTAAASR